MSLSVILQIIAACAFLAAFPAAWGYIFYKKQPEDRFHTSVTFVIDMGAGVAELV